MDEFEQTITELEALFTDPEFKETLDEVRQINELLADEPTSESDAQAIIEDLNAKWRAKDYYGKEMFVTGNVHVGGTYGDVEYGDLDPESMTTFTNGSFISKGFVMIASLQEGADGPLVRQQVIMNGMVEIDDDTEYGIAGKSNEACGIILSPETNIECKELTAPKAAAWLEMYYPDTKLLLDACVIEADDESGQTINLRDTPFTPAHSRKKEAQDQKRALQVYLEKQIQYELYVPYLMELCGDCEVFDAKRAKWEDKQITSNQKSMVIVQTLMVEIEKKTKEFKFFIQGLLVTSLKNDATLIKMPLQTILSMESGREKLRPNKK